jgi:hypothetical protein
VRFALRRSEVFVPIDDSTSTYSTMSFKSSLLIPLISLTGVLAIPTQHRLEDIQCRCLSFSPSSQPILCNYLEPHVLDWQTASRLASESDLKIHFSSELTVTQVLSIPSPLPSNILQSLSEEVGEPSLDPTEMVQNENKIICGLSDGAKHISNQDQSAEPDVHYLGVVLGVFMLLLMFYVVGEYLWTR